MAKKKSNAGRPTVMTEKVVKELEEAFSRGFSDIEACLYVNISKQALYDYCHKNPAFTDRKEDLKKTPLMKARNNIYNAIEDGDTDMSKWYAERKAKREFSTRVEQEIEGKVDTTINIVRARKGD